MAGHEHNLSHAREPSSIERISSIIISVLPLLLLIPAFVLAAVSSASKDWVYRQSYINGNLPLAKIPGFDYRSPWHSCVQTIDKLESNSTSTPSNSTTLTSSPWTLSCSSNHVPKGLCDFTAPRTDLANSPVFCQHLSLAAQLLYAGCALIGAALLLTFILTAITPPWTRHQQSRRTYTFHTVVSYLAFLLVLLTSLGALSLFMGMLIGSNALTVIQFPNADWFGHSAIGTDPTQALFAGPWLLGKAVGICAAGAVLAGIASYSVGMAWDLPRVAVLKSHHEREHHRGADGQGEDAVEKSKES